MVKLPDHVALARLFTREAIEILINILRDRKVPKTLRNEAARSLIAHGVIEPARRPDDATKLH